MKIHVEFVSPANLEGRVFDWTLEPGRIALAIDREVLGYLSEDSDAARPMITLMVAYALDAECRNGNEDALQWINDRGLHKLTADWTKDPRGITPMLLRLLLKATRPETAAPPPARPTLRLVH